MADRALDPESCEAAAALLGVRTSLDELATAPMWQVPSGDLATLLREVEHASRVLEAARLALVAEVDERGVGLTDGAASTGAYVAMVQGVSQASGRRTAALAQALRHCYPLTRAALGRAEIGLWQAERLVATLSSVAPRVEPARLTEAEAVLVGLADELEPRGFARACATMAAALDPDGAPPDDGVDRAAANVLRISEATPAGMRRLSGWLDDESAAVLLSALTPLAAPTAAGTSSGSGLSEQGQTSGDASAGGDPSAVQGRRARLTSRRHAARRMADALVALAHVGLSSRLIPSQGGSRAAVTVTIGLDVLRRAASGVGTLDWGGDLSAEAARRLACDAGVVPVVLGGAGQPLDVGRERRTVPLPMRRALTVRDGGCAFPGCGAPSSWCDGHHVRHWADGGATGLDNLVLLCGPHHRATHHAGWEIRIGDRGRPEFRPPRIVDPQQRWRRAHDPHGASAWHEGRLRLARDQQ